MCVCICVCVCLFVCVCVCVCVYLKMKMKSMSSMQKVATLSMVFIRTTSCLLRAGRNLTSFSTRSSRKVLSTDRPPSDWPTISHTLEEGEKREIEKHKESEKERKRKK